MKALLTLLVTVFSLSSLALTRAESRERCLALDVENLNEEDTVWEQTYSRDISVKTNAQISNLPTHVKQKLIILAKLYIREGYRAYEGTPEARFDEQREIRNTVNAVDYLRAINEFPDEEMQFVYYENKDEDRSGFGGRVNWLSLYPGAQVGLIYPDIDEGLQPLAEISDGWVSCIEAE